MKQSIFDGKKIRDDILKNLADKVVLMSRHPILAEILIGNDSVSKQYAQLKKKMAEKTGITFNIYTFSEKDSEEEIVECIKFLNQDDEVNGIMIQIPVSKKFDRDRLISAISEEKDVDGLRFCLGLKSNFRPPVVLAILEALGRSQTTDNQETMTNQVSRIQISKGKKIALIGKGFLVGNPLARELERQGIKFESIDSSNMHNSELIIRNSDIIISATGKAGIIKPEMVKEGAVLIDAGTAEENGELKGDIDPKAYSKAAYYTPVPGGIGPVTVALLFKNLVDGGNYDREIFS